MGRYIVLVALVVVVSAIGMLWYRSEYMVPSTVKVERSLPNDRLSSAVLE